VTPQIEGTTPLWIAARVLLRERGDDFFRRIDKVLATFDPEAIHDLRVASRRAREGLALFEPCYGSRKIEPLIKRIKRVTRLLGDIRNTDEAILFFSELADGFRDSHGGDLETLLSLFRKKRKKGINRLRSGLPEIAPPSLRDTYYRAVDAPVLLKPPGNGADILAPLSGFACTAFDGPLSEIARLVPDARKAGEAGAQHLLRIAVKHWRYRIEILSFLMGKEYGEIHSAVKSYQEVLGKMHDLDVFAGIVREAGLPSLTTTHVLDIIKLKRQRYFDDFSVMLETLSLEMIGERVKKAL
jgi:CHAD domain-containing protein